MTSASLLNRLLLGVGVAYAQILPHSPGDASRTGGHLCSLRDETTMIGEVHSSYVATIFEGFGSSAASKDSFIVGKTSKGVRRALLKFDVPPAGFPPDFQIVCAEIRASFEKGLSSGPLQTQVHEVTTPWTTNGTTTLQGLNGNIAMDGDVTWDYAIYPSIKWANLGGDFAENALSLQHQLPQSNPNQPFEYRWFGYTHLMHSLVSRWIKDSKTNHGVLVKSPELPISQNAYSVYHGSDGAPNLVPKLIVVYTAPSLNYPHKVQHPHGNPNQYGGSPSNSSINAGDPNAGDNWHQVGDGYDNNGGSPSGSPVNAGDPNAGDNWHQVGDGYENNGGSPSGSPVNAGNPNAGDNWHQVGDGYENNGGSPSGSPVNAGNPNAGDNWHQVGDGYDNNGGTASPINSNNGSSNSGDSGGISSEFNEGLKFDPQSNSNNEYTAAALTITALILVGVVASLFGRNQFPRETVGELAPGSTLEDAEPPQSANEREIV